MVNQIKNRDKLLVELCDGLVEFEKEARQLRTKLDLRTIEVTFHNIGGSEFDFDFSAALGVLAQDLFWDERGNWADTEHLTMRII